MQNKTKFAFKILIFVFVSFALISCTPRNPLADAYPDWTIDNTPFETPPSQCVSVDGIDGSFCPDGWTDGTIDGTYDYTTDFDIQEQEYTPDIPDGEGIPVKSCETIVSFRPSTPLGPSDTISIAGEFNDWNTSTHKLTDTDGDGTYTISLELSEGEYAYKFVKNQTQWFLDPENPWTKYYCSGGSCELNSNLRVDDCQKPSLVMISFSAEPNGNLSALVQYVDGSNASGPDPDSIRVTINRNPSDFTFDSSTGLIAITKTGLEHGKVMLKVEAQDLSGRIAKPLYIPGWVEEKAWDWRDGIMYFAFTDRFFDGDSSNNHPIGVELPADYRGGDFAGIRIKIEEGYFSSMGVNVLWISPPYENPTSSGIGHDGHYYSGYHGYWPVDPIAAETNFGGDDELENLLDTAHRNGIRVLMDSVLNHIHIEHPYWSAHRGDGWFHGTGDCVCGRGGCDWDSHRIDCWFTSYLPDIDYTKHDALVTMVNDTLDWIFEIGFDGLRVDAVKHFEHIVGQRLALEMNEKYEIAGQRFYMVGETFTGGYGGNCGGGPDFIMQYISPIELDGQFDFPLFWVILDVFARESADMVWLDTAVRGLETCYGSYPIMSTFLGNHDVARFISVANGDNIGEPWSAPPPVPSNPLPYQKLRLAFTFLLTYTGIPLIYYGDEIGMPGAGDPDNRRMMKFTGLSANERLVLDRVRAAGTVRINNESLRRGTRKTIYVDSNFYVYVRGTGTTAVLVALNRNNFEVSKIVNIPPEIGISDGTIFSDALGSGTFTVSGGTINLQVRAKDGVILIQ